MEFNKLIKEEEHVIIYKGTEPPFSGEYDKHFAHGTYVCRRCDAPLYASKNKFDAGCGWPSFDEEIEGAVTRVPDQDGKRTEILCKNCGGHLGHVFVGENLTRKNTRHCVNSLSLRFIPQGHIQSQTKANLDQATAKTAGIHEIAVFGGGCFWCYEAIFSRLKGVMAVESGYAGGTTKNPTYEEVCIGKTGHAEVIRITFDPSIISYEMLLTIFFSVHDPTQKNRQGADEGSQYRSVIFSTTQAQKEAAERSIQKLTADRVFQNPIVTEIQLLNTFYEAEKYHQRYFDTNPEKPYCQFIISPKLLKFQEKYSKFLKTNL